MRRLGCICNIFESKSIAVGGAFGNCLLRGTGILFESFLMKRFAFSDVTKSRSCSGSFPSLSEIIVS